MENQKTLSFSLSIEQEKKLEEWKKTLPGYTSATIGGAFTYSFTPNGLGYSLIVYRADGKQIDLTDYASW